LVQVAAERWLTQPYWHHLYSLANQNTAFLPNIGWTTE